MIPTDRRLAIIAAADAAGHNRDTIEWAYDAYAVTTDTERRAVENIYYALPMPRVRFSDVLRRELLGEEKGATHGT